MNTSITPKRPHSEHRSIRHFLTASLHFAADFVKKNTVLVIAVLLAVVTSVIVPPDSEYIGYFDFRTLSCLFSTLAVICALKNIRFFTFLAKKIIACTGNLRTAVLALVFITFVGSMLIANDMALLTFLPLGFKVLDETGNKRHMAFTFIMQNIAANLGGMLTPFGNPQNLYLYSRFSIPTGSFMLTMAPPFLISVTLITVLCLVFVKPHKLVLEDKEKISLPKKRTVIYILLFALSIVMVFRLIPYYIGLAVIIAALIFLDRKALGRVDYALLLTFAAFFVFAGNMGRVELVQKLFSGILEKSTLLVSALSCQVISNVPSAILLSQFTDNWRELLVGVNIGGVGTLISSLASLITFREYSKHNHGKAGKYIALFSAVNFAFLILLAVAEYFILG